MKIDDEDDEIYDDPSTYEEKDDLGLYNALIDIATVAFLPKKELTFRLFRPESIEEDNTRYCRSSITFFNVIYCDFDFAMDFYIRRESPQFYRSAILEDSNFLKEVLRDRKSLNLLEEDRWVHIRFIYFYGDMEDIFDIVCQDIQGHVEGDDSRPLDDFEEYGRTGGMPD